MAIRRIGFIGSLQFSGSIEIDDGDSPGGGGVPEWVPEGATFFADFENGHYWNGTSEVAFEDMIEQPEEQDYEISGGFLNTTGDNLIFNAATEGAFIDPSGHTIVIEGEFIADWETMTRLTDGLSHRIDSYVDGADTSGVFIEINGTDEYVSLQSDKEYDGLVPLKVAMTFIPTKMSMSDRGDPVVTQALTTGTHWWTWSDFMLTAPGQKFKTITAYPPKDDADLPALSALA